VGLGGGARRREGGGGGNGGTGEKEGEWLQVYYEGGKDGVMVGGWEGEGPVTIGDVRRKEQGGAEED